MSNQHIDMQKLISLINDTSARIKIDGLRAVDNIKDWSAYSINEIKQLLEVLTQNLNYPRSDVKLLAEHAHKKVKKVLSEIISQDPNEFISTISNELVSEDQNETNENLNSTKISEEKYVKDDIKSISESTITSNFETKKQNDEKITEEVKNDNESKSSSKPVSKPVKPKPQMIVVHASPETRLTKYFLTFLSLVIFGMFLFIAYPQFKLDTNVSKFAMISAATYLFFLFCPITYISSGAKLKISIITLIGIIFYMCFESGFGVDFQLNAQLQKFNFQIPENLNLNELIIKFAVLLSIVSTIIMFLADSHLTSGFRIFMFMLGLYSLVTVIENFTSSLGIKELFLENGSIGQKIPFMYLKPFYFAVNIFFPLCLITVIFEILSDIFELSFRKFFSSVVSLVFFSGICAFYFYTLNDFSVVNVSNLFIPQTVNIEKISSNDFYGLVNTFMIQKGDVKEAVIDRIRIAKAEIYSNRELESENKMPEKILPPPIKNPCISPNGYYLAFVVNDGKKSDIMLYNLKTRGEVKVLVSDGSFNDFPAFSPSSDKIAFISNKNGADNIYVINIDKSGLKQLTETATSKSHLIWAPQKNAISFLENGSLIRLPLETSKNEFLDPKEKVKLLNSILEKILPQTKPICDISTLKPDIVNIRYKTNSKNVAEVFQEIASAMVATLVVFEDIKEVEKVNVITQYFNDKIEVTTFLSIIKQNLEDVKFVTSEKIKVWLKNSIVHINDKSKVFD